jgi:hypothetical protein
MAAQASPALATAIATERTPLKLDAIAGPTTDAFQQQVEDLGRTPVWCGHLIIAKAPPPVGR